MSRLLLGQILESTDYNIHWKAVSNEVEYPYLNQNNTDQPYKKESYFSSPHILNWGRKILTGRSGTGGRKAARAIAHVHGVCAQVFCRSVSVLFSVWHVRRTHKGLLASACEVPHAGWYVRDMLGTCRLLVRAMRHQ